MRYIFLFLLALRCLGIDCSAQTITFTYDAYGNRLTKSVTGNTPQPAVTGDTIACQNSSVTLSASGGATYLWSTGSTQASITVLVDSARTYTLTAYNANGCAATVQHTVQIIPVPATGTITGDSLVFTGQINVYHVPNHDSSFYLWSVTTGMGTTLSLGNDSVYIQWGNTSGPATIQVRERVLGTQCESAPVFKTVMIQQATRVPAAPLDFIALSVYPNPTEAGAAVKVTLPAVASVEIAVTDGSGRRLWRKTVNGQSAYTIDIEKSVFPATGIYLISVRCQGHTASQKLEVKR